MSVDESVCSSKDTPTRCKDNRKTLLYAAQRGMYEKRMKSPRAFSVLPTYGQTPPGCKIYNPFKTDVDLLEGHTCSPTIFTKTVSSESGEFTWSIDDISRINPAPINSPIELPEEKLEDHMEEKAQAAIERYFSLRHDIVSPISGPGQWISPAASATPASSSTPCHGRSQRVQDVSTQTVLSFPAVLPPELETILKQYNIKIEEETDTIEDCNLSNSNNSSLRRKLFFNKEEFISPVKKLCYDGSPTSNSYTKPSRIDWTLEQKTEILSSPDISPIKFKPEPMCISGPVKDGIFTSTIMCGSMDTGYSTMEQWRSTSVTIDNNHS